MNPPSRKNVLYHSEEDMNSIRTPPWQHYSTKVNVTFTSQPGAAYQPGSISMVPACHPWPADWIRQKCVLGHKPGTWFAYVDVTWGLSTEGNCSLAIDSRTSILYYLAYTLLLTREPPRFHTLGVRLHHTGHIGVIDSQYLTPRDKGPKWHRRRYHLHSWL